MAGKKKIKKVNSNKGFFNPMMVALPNLMALITMLAFSTGMIFLFYQGIPTLSALIELLIMMAPLILSTLVGLIFVGIIGHHLNRISARVPKTLDAYDLSQAATEGIETLLNAENTKDHWLHQIISRKTPSFALHSSTDTLQQREKNKQKLSLSIVQMIKSLGKILIASSLLFAIIATLISPALPFFMMAYYHIPFMASNPYAIAIIATGTFSFLTFCIMAMPPTIDIATALTRPFRPRMRFSHLLEQMSDIGAPLANTRPSTQIRLFVGLCVGLSTMVATNILSSLYLQKILTHMVGGAFFHTTMTIAGPILGIIAALVTLLFALRPYFAHQIMGLMAESCDVPSSKALLQKYPKAFLIHNNKDEEAVATPKTTSHQGVSA